MEQRISQIVRELFGSEITVQVTRPEAAFGDASTNVALQLAAGVGKSPREIADMIAAKLRETGDYADVSIAGPGFINIRLTDTALRSLADTQAERIYQDINYVAEYSCPNAFKELHTGHLYQTILGDSIARLIAHAGADVHRTSFGGDVGLHVAKALWGIIDALGGEYPEKLATVGDDAFTRSAWISQCYVAGAAAYEHDAVAKVAIGDYNTAIYHLHTDNIHDTPFAELYWTTRQWSYDYFDAFYRLLAVDPLRYYPESSTTERGLQLVRDLKDQGKLVESEGAVIYPGSEAEHLDARVFITGKGLPTYETKDIGVIFAEREDYNFTRRLLITGDDQRAYMRVVFAVADMIQPGLRDQMTHITNGLVKFGDGKKMSSRLGNVTRAIDVLDIVRDKTRALVSDASLVETVALGAIKYEFLRYRVGGDIAFDLEESVSLAGNSGPYLQYAHARACSLLSKLPEGTEIVAGDTPYDEHERAFMRKLSESPEVTTRAARELMPHYICNYLYELAQEFNRFYEQCRVVGDERQAVRAPLVVRYRDTLKFGLDLLGIAAPERM